MADISFYRPLSGDERRMLREPEEISSFTQQAEKGKTFFENKYIDAANPDPECHSSTDKSLKNLLFLRNAAVLGYCKIDWTAFKDIYKNKTLEETCRGIDAAKADLVKYRPNIEMIVGKWVQKAQEKVAKDKMDKQQ